MKPKKARYFDFLIDCRDLCDGKNQIKTNQLALDHRVSHCVATTLSKAGALKRNGRLVLWTGANKITDEYVEKVIREVLMYQRQGADYKVNDRLANPQKELNFDDGRNKENKPNPNAQKQEISVSVFWGLFKMKKTK